MFIARQPILNHKLNLYGYELLTRRDNDSTTFNCISPTTATASILGDLYETGVAKIVDTTKAFINFNYECLMSDAVELLDPNAIIIEVLEDVKVDVTLINRLKYLRSKGYTFALDDFVEELSTYPLVPIAKYIKFDIKITPLDSIQLEVKQALQQNKILIAEKVETFEEYKLAKEMGFHLFQGFFFSKPDIIHKSNSKKSTKSQYLRVLDELNKKEPSYQALAEIIEMDLNLSYRLMKIIKNTKHECCEIYSIKRALVCMGFREIERWIKILMMQDLSSNKPTELLKLSLVRSKFGEYIAIHSRFKKRKLEISMMCLFSTIDAVLDQPMETAVSEIELPIDVKKTLVDNSGNLSSIRRLIASYEAGEWDKVHIFAEGINMNPNLLQEGYMDALVKADEIMSML